MGEEVVCAYLRSKLWAILHEAEGDPSIPSGIISRFRSIERRIIFMGENSVRIPIDLLYDLIDQVSECRVFASKANNGFHLFRVLWFKRKMRSRVVEMDNRLTATTSTTDPQSSTIVSNHRVQQTYPAQDPSLIIGFELEAKKIEAWLLGEQIDRVGIVGRCGGGKTALAQKMFGSSRIQAEFSPRIWVCLSNMLLLESEAAADPRARVLKYILEEMGVSETMDNNSVDKLVEKLQRGLTGKRYLIVLDDVWRVDEWYPSVVLAHGLPRGSGGAVIATGRRENVITRIVRDHDHVIRMEPLLSDLTCWSIFSDVVSRQHQAGMPNLLLQMEEDIIQNCHGLPLAANALATIIAVSVSVMVLPWIQFHTSWFWIPARELYIAWGDDTAYWRWISPTPPEVEEVAELVSVCWLEIRGSVELNKLLPKTSYSAYLVFKLNKGCIGLGKAMSQVGFGSRGERIPLIEDGEGCSSVFIDRENTPEEEERGFPQSRGKEWMEIKLGEFFNDLGRGDEAAVEAILFEVQQGNWKSGLIVKGIHFRPNYYPDTLA